MGLLFLLGLFFANDLISQLLPASLITLKVRVIAIVVHLVRAILLVADALIVELKLMGHAVLDGDEVEFSYDRRMVAEAILANLH